MRYRHLLKIQLPLILVALFVSLANISFAEQKPNPQLYVINVDGSGLKQITKELDRSYGSPQWSPDGKQIVADSWLVAEFNKSSYSATHMFVMKPDGSNRKDIGLGAMPDWSPDGKQLVFHTYQPTRGISVINVDGTGREQVAGHWGCPRWSSKGNQIVSLSKGEFAILDLMTGVEKQLRLTKGIYSPTLGFNLSPDGNQISFSDSNNGGVAVITLDKAGKCKSIQQLISGRFHGHSSWSPDGTQIVFMGQSQEDTTIQIYIIENAPGKKPRRLPGQSSNASNTSPDWSPDGKQIVFSSDPVE